MRQFIIAIFLFVITSSCDRSGSNREPADTGLSKDDKITNDARNEEVDECIGGILGTYTYCPDPVFEDDCYSLILQCENDSLSAMLFGPRHDPDHGLYFFLAKIDEVDATDSTLHLNFEIGQLFRVPITQNNFKILKDSASGIENTYFQMEGTWNADNLSLRSTNKSDGDELDFRNMLFTKRK